MWEVEVETDMILNPGTYTVINHITFGASERLNPTSTTRTATRYSVASGIFRDALPPQDIMYVGKKIQYAMAGVIGATALFLLINLVLLLWYRKHKIMRFSQVNILIGMTFCGLVALTGLPIVPINTDLSCMLRPWLTIIPLNFMFGLLFGKTWRIW